MKCPYRITIFGFITIKRYFICPSKYLILKILLTLMNAYLYFIIIYRLTLVLSCAMKFESYPHDTQICSMMIESCSYDRFLSLILIHRMKCDFYLSIKIYIFYLLQYRIRRKIWSSYGT